MFSDKLLNKAYEVAKEVAKQKEKFKFCLKYSICPVCANKLICKEVWEDGGKDYYCASCDRKYST